MTKSKEKNKGKLGYWDLLSISMGSIVGAGIVILTGIGISITGYGVPWAMLVALGIVFLPTLCIAALGAAIPSTGGTYTYVRDLLGLKTGFFYLALLVAGQLVLATFALGFADYASQLLPGVNTTLIAALAMTVCYVANLLGVETAARFQLIIVVSLVISLITFVIFGIGYVDNFDNYTSVTKVFPSGVGAFISAAFLLRFGMVGGEFISELGNECKNPGRHIPMAMMTSILVVSVLYFGIGIVATGVLPLSDVKGKSLAFIAKEIFPHWMYVFFIVSGIMLALISSLNAIFAWCTKGLFKASHDGWFPKKFAQTNKYGTPYIILTLFFIVGMLPIITETTIEYVTVLGNAVGIVFGIIPALALFNLYDKNPEAYEKAAFKLPRWAMKTFPVIALILYSYGVYLSSINFIKKEHVIVFVLYSSIAIVYGFWREENVKRVRAEKAKEG